MKLSIRVWLPLLLLAGVSPAVGDSIFSPPGLEGVEGEPTDSTLGIILNKNYLIYGPLRTEQVFDAASLGSIGGPVWINQIWFRTHKSSLAFSDKNATVTVTLAQTGANTLSGFITLAGLPAAYNGELKDNSAGAWSGGPCSGAGCPSPFTLGVVFTTPFLYSPNDPDSPNLLVDITTTASDFNSTAYRFDTYAAGSNVRVSTNNRGKATPSANGLVVRLDYTPFNNPVPEPGSGALVLLGAVVLRRFRRR
jgi:hypothetical protein